MGSSKRPPLRQRTHIVNNPAPAQAAGPASAMPARGPVPTAPIPFDFRLGVGLFGVLLAAMMAGLNNRVVSLCLPDIRGQLGWGLDEASWISTAYSAGELVAMPFAAWFSITFSLRRFHLSILGLVMAIAVLLPLVHNLPVFIALRALQGLFAGALIPLLMLAALRFLPPPIRLHGLALYALTATFAPNVALSLGAQWLDNLHDWRWVFWHVIPLGAFAVLLVAWGIPQMPTALPRVKQANWIGFGLGIVGLSLLVVGLDQGTRLDWFNSPLIVVSLAGGGAITALYLLSEWFHAAPFIRIQLLERRNLGLGFSIFFIMLIAMSSAVALPAAALSHLQNFRLPETAPVGLIVGLPQVVLGPLMALLLYQRWVDARYLFAAGLACIALACFLAARITSEWMVAELVWIELLQAVGQAMAVVSMLFLATSVVAPMEGPFVAGIVNTLRALGSVVGGALINLLMTKRGDFHNEMLIDTIGLAPEALQDASIHGLLQWVGEQSLVLTTADQYRILGVMAACLIPLALCLQYVPAPETTPMPAASPH
jgi:MFS transporter, DHA2 family, multidrug resistance protein